MKINNIEYYNRAIHISGSKTNAVGLSRVNYNEALDSVSFGMRVDYGVPAKLPQELQDKVKNIYLNIDFIQNFFIKFTKNNPQLGAKIKKEYTDLIPKRQSGMVFKLPDTENTLEIMKSQTRENILYISINNNDDNEYNGIVIDGEDRLIANYLKKHPHMLPRGIKYMNSERMAEAEPEKFISIADEKLQKYANYIKDLQSGVTPMPKLSTAQTNKVCSDKNEVMTATDNKSIKILNRTDPKTQQTKKVIKTSNKNYDEYMTDKAKNVIRQITDLSNMDAKSLPDYITPKLTPKGKIIALKVNTDDGGTLIVTKKIVGAYGNSMPYLSFEKSNTDNTYNFISIDMVANKILRTKTKGKPHISSDNIVYHLTPEELKRRKVEEKLDYYMSQIFRNNDDKKIIDNENIIETPVKNDTKEAQVKSDIVETPKKNKTSDNKTKKIQQKNKKDEPSVNTEKLMSNMIEQGKKDGSAAATEYFNAFQEQFLKDVRQKMTEFQANINKFMDTLISDLKIM